jgi:hypothetical protein
VPVTLTDREQSAVCGFCPDILKTLFFTIVPLKRPALQIAPDCSVFVPADYGNITLEPGGTPNDEDIFHERFVFQIGAPIDFFKMKGVPGTGVGLWLHESQALRFWLSMDRNRCKIILLMPIAVFRHIFSTVDRDILIAMPFVIFHAGNLAKQDSHNRPSFI